MLRNLLRHAISRRDLFKRSGFAAAAGLAPAAALAAPGALEVGPRLYESIGVRPVINCRGTLTIIGGSQTLPEVKKAMDEASRHYVHIDELMEAVAQRLSVITGAEYGIITAGCAAALAHVTAACMAGSAPERMQMLPDTTGMKNEVLAPRYSRNEYDHAIRMVGARIIDVANKEQFANAFTSRTAMVMVLAGPQDSGEFGLPFITVSRRRKVFRSLSMRRRRISPFRMCISSEAQILFAIAVARFSADRSARALRWAGRTFCKRPGSTARLITHSGER
jgi:L-seryl-tRNA(Ser) seleniumtransferase